MNGRGSLNHNRPVSGATDDSRVKRPPLIRKTPRSVVEPTDADILESAKCYFVFKRLLETEHGEEGTKRLRLRRYTTRQIKHFRYWFSGQVQLTG